MPVEFLTSDQQRRYGRFIAGPDQAQLDRYFHLDAADLGRVNVRRGEPNRPGYAVQLGTVRFLGTFLPDPTDVPPVVAEYLAKQLSIVNAGVLADYCCPSR